MDLAEIRKEYLKKSLDKDTVNAHPLSQLELWLSEAKDAGCLEYTAMTVATSTIDGQPSIRTVLLKYLKEDGLYFFTNYLSRKGKDLAVNKKIAVHFFWPELERQVKIEGFVHKAASEISDFYFNSRPFESQISALVSHQSSEIPDRKTIEEKWRVQYEKWKERTIERPDYWGGYQVKPTHVEFWQGRPFRMHDRLLYQKCIDGWMVKRLAP